MALGQVWIHSGTVTFPWRSITEAGATSDIWGSCHRNIGAHAKAQKHYYQFVTQLDFLGRCEAHGHIY